MRLLTLLFASVLAGQASGHPGNGIVALADGRVLTGDAVGNGVWLFEEGKAPKRQTSDFHCHWLTRGLDGNLYAENQGESNGTWTATYFRLDALGTRPVRLAQADLGRSAFTADRQGRLIFVDSQRLTQQTVGGAPAPFRGNGTVVPGDPPLQSVSALVWGPRDVLYVADGPHIRKVGSDGKIRLVTKFTGEATVPMYGGQGGAPRVWGIAVDGSERVYAALASHGQVVRVDPGGAREVLLTSPRDGWVATGVATRGESLYLLETKLDGNRNLGPRVRRGGRAGDWAVLGTVTAR